MAARSEVDKLSEPIRSTAAFLRLFPPCLIDREGLEARRREWDAGRPAQELRQEPRALPSRTDQLATRSRPAEIHCTRAGEMARRRANPPAVRRFAGSISLHQRSGWLPYVGEVRTWSMMQRAKPAIMGFYAMAALLYEGGRRFPQFAVVAGDFCVGFGGLGITGGKSLRPGTFLGVPRWIVV